MCVVLPLSLFHADGMPKAKGSLSDNVQTRDPSPPTPSPHAARSPSCHDLPPTEDNGGTFHVSLPPFNGRAGGTSPSEAAGRPHLSSYIHFNRYFHFPHAKLVDLDRMGITSEDSTPDITRIHSLESMESIRSGSNTTVVNEQLQRVDSVLNDMEGKDDKEGTNVGIRWYKIHQLSKPKMVEKNSNSSKPNDTASQSTGVFPRKDSLALDSYISIHKDAIRMQNSGILKSKPKTSSELLKPAEAPNDTRDAATKANEVHLHDNKIVPQKDAAKIDEAAASKKANYLPDDLITFKGRANKGMESDVDPLKSRVSLANRRLLRYSSQSTPVGDEIGRVRFSSEVDILEYDADTSGQCFRRLCCCYRAPPIKAEDINELQPGNSILVKTDYSTEELTENVCLNIRDDVPTIILEYTYKEQP